MNFANDHVVIFFLFLKKVVSCIYMKQNLKSNYCPSSLSIGCIFIVHHHKSMISLFPVHTNSQIDLPHTNTHILYYKIFV